MLSFKFNDIDLSTYGCYLQTAPNITRAPMNFNEIIVDGLDSTIIEEIGYTSYTKELKIGIINTSYLDDILKTLSGKGKLIFSNESDKYYNVSFLNQIDLEKLTKFRTASVVVKFQPYKYKINEVAKTSTTSSVTVVNAGNTKSLPKITLTGTTTSSITIKVNNTEVMTLSKLTTGITIDSTKHDCYYGSSKKNRDKTGSYPELKAGSNTITLTGTGASSVTQIKVEGYSRWL